MIPHRTVNCATLVTLALVAACAPDRVQQSPTPAAPATVAIDVHPADSAGVFPVSLSLTDSRGMTRIGSFVATVHYDTTRVRFVGTRSADSLSLAVFAIPGQVRLAGAAAAGFGAYEWAWLSFAAATPRVLSLSLSLEVAELTDLSGRELRPGIVIETSPRIAR